LLIKIKQKDPYINLVIALLNSLKDLILYKLFFLKYLFLRVLIAYLKIICLNRIINT
jgi:hypothetical protein